MFELLATEMTELSDMLRFPGQTWEDVCGNDDIHTYDDCVEYIMQMLEHTYDFSWVRDFAMPYVGDDDEISCIAENILSMIEG